MNLFTAQKREIVIIKKMKMWFTLNQFIISKCKPIKYCVHVSHTMYLKAGCTGFFHTTFIRYQFSFELLCVLFLKVLSQIIFLFVLIYKVL